MSSLNITLQPKTGRKDIIIKMDADKFERFAASLGLFNASFLKSLDRAEHDYKTKKIRKIKSLKELTK